MLRDLSVDFDALGFEASQPVTKFRIVERDSAAFDRLMHAGDPRVEIGLAREQAIELPRRVLLGLPLARDRAFQHRPEPCWLKHHIGEMIDHQVVEQAFPDRPAGTARCADPMRGRAGVIAVAARFAGPKCHRPATSGATGQIRQKGRVSGEANRNAHRVPFPHRCPHRFKRRIVDDRGHRNDDMLVTGLWKPGLGVGDVEDMPPDIGRAMEDVVNGLNRESPSVAGRQIAAIEFLGDRLDPNRHDAIHAKPRQLKDRSDDLRFRRVNLQPFFSLGAAGLGDHGPVAERRPAVDEALAGILFHAAQRMFGVLLRLVLIHQANDLANEIGGRSFAKFLGD